MLYQTIRRHIASTPYGRLPYIRDKAESSRVRTLELDTTEASSRQMSPLVIGTGWKLHTCGQFHLITNMYEENTRTVLISLTCHALTNGAPLCCSVGPTLRRTTALDNDENKSCTVTFIPPPNKLTNKVTAPCHPLDTWQWSRTHQLTTGTYPHPRAHIQFLQDSF